MISLQALVRKTSAPCHCSQIISRNSRYIYRDVKQFTDEAIFVVCRHRRAHISSRMSRQSKPQFSFGFRVSVLGMEFSFCCMAFGYHLGMDSIIKHSFLLKFVCLFVLPGEVPDLALTVQPFQSIKALVQIPRLCCRNGIHILSYGFGCHLQLDF